MNATYFQHYNILILAIYRLAQECKAAEFQNELLKAVQVCLPFDSAMWGTATMRSTGIDIHSIHLFNSSSAMLEAYETVKQQDIAALRLTQQNRATLSFGVDDFPGEEIRQFLHDFGHRNMVITSDINPGTNFVQWLSLYRIDGRARYSEEEVGFLSSLAPHLMQALAINRVVHLEQLNADTARAKWSVAIADPRGVIYHADEHFVLLLKKLDRAAGDRLPQQLISSIAAGESVLIANGVVISCKCDQGLLFLRARVEHRVDTLSAREFLVAKLVASGLTQNEVARQLNRSTETIRSQVKSVFRKLDITNGVLLATILAIRDE